MCTLIGILLLANYPTKLGAATPARERIRIPTYMLIAGVCPRLAFRSAPSAGRAARASIRHIYCLLSSSFYSVSPPFTRPTHSLLGQLLSKQPFE